MIPLGLVLFLLTRTSRSCLTQIRHGNKDKGSFLNRIKPSSTESYTTSSERVARISTSPNTNTKKEKQCAYCHVTFSTSSWNAKYCSVECRQEADKILAKKNREKKLEFEGNIQISILNTRWNGRKYT
jgi:hypothetical protein